MYEILKCEHEYKDLANVWYAYEQAYKDLANVWDA